MSAVIAILANGAYIDGKRKDGDCKKSLPSCETSVGDCAHLVWNRRKKTNKLQDTKAPKRAACMCLYLAVTERRCIDV